jgi:hypothetical protein
VPSGVAMSELSSGIKRHTSKSRETIPLSGCLMAGCRDKAGWDETGGSGYRDQADV